MAANVSTALLPYGDSEILLRKPKLQGDGAMEASLANRAKGKRVRHRVAAYVWDRAEVKKFCLDECPACAEVAHGDGNRVREMPEMQCPDSSCRGGG